MKYHNRWYTESDSAGSRPSDGEGWGEWRSSNPEKTGGEVFKKFFFSFFLTLGSQVGLKITRGGGGGPPQDPPGTFLAIDPTQRIFHICKWSSLEFVIWTLILQLNLYCRELKKRTVVCRVSRPLFITDYTGVMITPGKISLAICNFAFCACGWGW